MTQVALPTSTAGTSPFDAIRRVDASGEYWTARDLMQVVNYEKWERFADAVERAIISIDNAEPKTGESAAQHVSRFREAVVGGIPGAFRNDYRLTRHGAYMTVMNGDVRKQAIADAQTYFLAQTRRAEFADQLRRAEEVVERDTNHPAIPQSFADALRLAADQQEQIEAQRLALDSAAPKVAYVDTFLRNSDSCLMRQLAKRIGYTEADLRDELMRRRIIFRTPVSRYSKSKGKDVTEYRYEAATSHMAWFREGDQPRAPRLHNDQMRTTLYVTPTGKVGIAQLLGRLDVTQLEIEGVSA